MSQSPRSPPQFPSRLPEDFAMKLNPQPPGGTMYLSTSEQNNQLNKGKMYKAADLDKGYDLINGLGGRPKPSKKRPTARRLRSSKRNARKAHTTRRR